jgi:hypothetical protein
LHRSSDFFRSRHKRDKERGEERKEEEEEEEEEERKCIVGRPATTTAIRSPTQTYVAKKF